MVDYSRFDKIIDSDDEEETQEIPHPFIPPPTEVSSSAPIVEPSSSKEQESKEEVHKVERSREGKEGRHAFVYQNQLGLFFFFSFLCLSD